MIYKTNESAINDSDLVVLESSDVLNEDKQIWSTSNTLSRVARPSEGFKQTALTIIRGYKAVFNDALDRKVGEGDWSRRLSSSLSTFLIYFLGGYLRTIELVAKAFYNNLKNAEEKVMAQPAKTSYTLTFNARGKRKDDRTQPTFSLIPEIITKSGLTKKGTSGSYNYYYKEAKDSIYLAYYDGSRATWLKSHNLCVTMIEIENTKENKDVLKSGTLTESAIFSNLELI